MLSAEKPVTGSENESVSGMGAKRVYSLELVPIVALGATLSKMKLAFEALAVAGFPAMSMLPSAPST